MGWRLFESSVNLLFMPYLPTPLGHTVPLSPILATCYQFSHLPACSPSLEILNIKKDLSGPFVVHEQKELLQRGAQAALRPHEGTRGGTNSRAAFHPPLRFDEHKPSEPPHQTSHGEIYPVHLHKPCSQRFASIKSVPPPSSEAWCEVRVT